MVFLGKTFFADKSCVSNTTPTVFDNINYFEIENAWFDDFYVSNNIDSYEIPTVWSKDTLIHAAFNNDTVAGNMNWYLDTIKNILVKRKGADEDTWITLYNQDITSVDDFNFSYKDYLAKGNMRYTYAIVPVSHTGVEGSYILAFNPITREEFIDTEFYGVTISGKDKTYTAILEPSSCDTTRNQKVGVVELMNSDKPKVFKNSQVNYDTGNTSGLFVGVTDNYEFDFINGNKYRKEFIDFLTDGYPKYIKSHDGRAWLVMVNGNPNDTMQDHPDKRIVDFDWVQVGDALSEKDLYENGLINAEKKYWSNYY